MRKRRRLANKMTIMVCAVLIAVSAFFYAPMKVNAQEVINFGLTENLSIDEVMTSDVANDLDVSLTPDLSMSSGYYGKINSNTGNYVLASGLDSNSVYKVVMTIDNTVTPSVSNSYTFLRSYSLMWNNIYNFINSDALTLSGVRTSSVTRTFYIDGSSLMSSKPFTVRGVVTSSSVSNLSLDFSFNISIDSITEVSNTASDEYQDGYNAGYSAGEQAGYGNGYSQGFTDGEASVDTDAIYDEAYQAGIDSVDTQSYYDAGYQAGYQVAYSEGYESGYDVGYQDAMDRIANWGADTSDYPSLKYSFFDDELQLICDVFTSAPSTSYDSALLCYLDFDVNPNHTYKFVVKTGGTTGGTYNALYSDYKLNFVIGSNVINATNNIDKTFDFFIPGYNMGSSILFEAFVYDCVYYGGVSEEDGFLKDSGQVYPTLKNCYIDIYDMGPSGDTQNHIANQTDQLTNGYDDSKGNTVNSELSTGLNQFETAENSLFATATTGMKDFTFFDFESVPAMLTAVTFITSIMGSWFEQAGGASGVGIVLSILFSVMLVSMVLGLYRLYQSAGHRAEARERHRERMEQWKKGK